MAKLILETNSVSTTDIEVRESDQITGSVFVSIKRNYGASLAACDELFLDPTQLELLGRFFCRQADEIRNTQAHRKLENTIK